MAKNIAYERLCQKLDTKEGEKQVFKLARIRERRTRDLDHIRYIEDENDTVLVKEAKIKERLEKYFYKLFNKEMIKYPKGREQGWDERQQHHQRYSLISEEETKET